ncbi:MAB_1171c family putative transporter [Amycolatopsis sp. MtRt-6]|uniref:MAB_1171c family putative transporter n=1 Tax=Amycolatopsis sp. MtRt-6 TaxID=2792782 RepID=UPI001A8E1794|nr:MAB_1171c family putative transporter [Amycolatopsis sp. MtRt-6]
MSGKITLLVVQAVILFPALLWKIYQLTRAPGDVARWMVTACLACFAAAYPLGLLAGDVNQPYPGPIVPLLFQHVFLCGLVFSLACFFLFSARPGSRARRRARLEAIPLGAAILVMATVTVLMPDVPPVQYPRGAVSVFYLAADLYLTYGIASACFFARRYARGAAPRLARGLSVASVGFAFGAVGGATLIAVVLVHWAGAAIPWLLVQATVWLVFPSAILLVVGLSYPGVATRLAAARVWWQHLRTYHRLRPLWTKLHEAFPEDALSRTPLGRWDTLSVLGVHRRYYRRVIECRDGLVRISPYVARLDGPLPDRLTEALRAHARREPVPEQGMPLAVPEGGGLDDDVRELVTLSESLKATAA